MRLRPSSRRSAPADPSRDRDGTVAGRPQTATAANDPLVKEHVTRLVVELGNRAAAWRDAAVDAEFALIYWNATREKRGDAAAAYLAAIEREEQAAIEYHWAWQACCAALPQRTDRNDLAIAREVIAPTRRPNS